MMEQPVKESIFFIQKRERFNKMKRSLNALPDGKISFVKFAAIVEEMLGVSRDTAINYLHTLRDSEFIRIEEGLIILNKKEAKPDQG